MCVIGNVLAGISSAVTLLNISTCQRIWKSRTVTCIVGMPFSADLIRPGSLSSKEEQPPSDLCPFRIPEKNLERSKGSVPRVLSQLTVAMMSLYGVQSSIDTLTSNRLSLQYRYGEQWHAIQQDPTLSLLPLQYYQ